MALYEFEGKRPAIGAGSFVPESADIIGDAGSGSATRSTGSPGASRLLPLRDRDLSAAHIFGS